MTDIYTQENGSKKKFLAPVLVILLCMVSLTAAGYAYSATVNVDDGTIDPAALDFEYTTAGPMFADSDVDNAEVVRAYEISTYGFVEEVWKVKNRTVQLENTGAVCSSAFKLKTDDPTQMNKIKVAVTGITITGLTEGKYTYEGEQFVLNAILPTMTITLKDTAATPNVLGVYTATIAADGTVTVAESGVSLVTLAKSTDFPITAEVVFNFEDGVIVDIPDTGNATGYVGALKALKFSVALEALANQS